MWHCQGVRPFLKITKGGNILTENQISPNLWYMEIITGSAKVVISSFQLYHIHLSNTKPPISYPHSIPTFSVLIIPTFHGTILTAPNLFKEVLPCPTKHLQRHWPSTDALTGIRIYHVRPDQSQRKPILQTCATPKKRMRYWFLGASRWHRTCCNDAFV